MQRTRALAPLTTSATLQALGAGDAVVLDAMLGPAVLAAARETALELDAMGRLRAAGIGRDAVAAPSIRGDRITWLEVDTCPAAFLPVLDLMQSAMETLNETAYIGADELEAQLAIYDAGSGYERHRDAIAGTTARRMTAIYYLGAWQPGDGGELEVWGEGEAPARVIEPIGDRLVLFRSEVSDHAVRPVIRGPRAAISAFFRRRSLH